MGYEMPFSATMQHRILDDISSDVYGRTLHPDHHAL
jgi:hypothetical protein